MRPGPSRPSTRGILITDPNRPDDPIVYVSPGFERLTGYAAADALGRNCRFLQGKDTDPDQVARLRTAIRDATACTVELLNLPKGWHSASGTSCRSPRSGTPRRRVTHFVERADRRDGPAAARSAVPTGPEDAGHWQTGRRRGARLQQPPHHHQRVQRPALFSRSRRATRPANSSPRSSTPGSCSAGLTRQLLVFSRQQVLAPKVLDLNAVVTEAERMLRRVIGEDVRLAMALDTELGVVRSGPGAVGAGAVEPGGERPGRHADRRPVDDRNAQRRSGRGLHPVPPGHALRAAHVLLAVSDSGCGMTDEVKTRIFEPFFTTKEPGKGTGLGLATVYGIVHQSGGAVDVYSEVGVGTTFKVYLPRVKRTGGSGPIRLRPRHPAAWYGNGPAGRRRRRGPNTHAPRPGRVRVHRPGGGRRRGALVRVAREHAAGESTC